MAIMAINSVIDASAAASSTTARTMAFPHVEHIGNIVHVLFAVNRRF
jgi:hypothetical protein